MMVVPVSAQGGSFRTGTPHRVFEDPLLRSHPTRQWDVTPDWKGFVVIRQNDPEEATHPILVQNWFEELKRLVPTE